MQWECLCQVFVTFIFLFVLPFVVVFVSELHPLCRGYEKLFKASLWETKVGSIKFIPLEKMYHRSNRASIGKTSKWHHRMSWLFLYIGHKRTQLCLICDTRSDYMVTTTTEGRAITSSCGALPTRSWSTKMVMFRPLPCPPWWCRPWWPSSHPRVDHDVRKASPPLPPPPEALAVVLQGTEPCACHRALLRLGASQGEQKIKTIKFLFSHTTLKTKESLLPNSWISK